MPICSNCKATTFEETEDGMLMCIECGMQVRGIVEEARDFGDGAGFSQRTVVSSVEKQVDSTIKWPAAALVFEAFQHILQTLVGSAVNQNPSCCADLPEAVGNLWFRTMQLFPDARQDSPPLRWLPAIARIGGRPITLTPPLAAVLVLLAGLQLGLPLLVSDACMWCESSALLAARQSLPTHLHVVSRMLPLVVWCRGTVDSRLIRRNASELVGRLRLALPRPSTSRLRTRLLEELGLPPSIGRVAFCLNLKTKSHRVTHPKKKLMRREAWSTALGVFERAVRESLLEAATEIACALKLCYDMRLALHCDNAGADHLDGRPPNFFSELPRWAEIEKALLQALHHGLTSQNGQPQADRPFTSPSEAYTPSVTPVNSSYIQLPLFHVITSIAALQLNAHQLNQYLKEYRHTIAAEMPKQLLPSRSGPMWPEIQEEQHHFTSLRTALADPQSTPQHRLHSMRTGLADECAGSMEAVTLSEAERATAVYLAQLDDGNHLPPMSVRCALVLRCTALAARASVQACCRLTRLPLDPKNTASPAASLPQVVHQHLALLERRLFPWPILASPYSLKDDQQNRPLASDSVVGAGSLQLPSDNLSCSSCGSESTMLPSVILDATSQGWEGQYIQCPAVNSRLGRGWLLFLRNSQKGERKPPNGLGSLTCACPNGRRLWDRCTLLAANKRAVYVSPAGERFQDCRSAIEAKLRTPARCASRLVCALCNRPAGGPLAGMDGTHCSCVHPVPICTPCAWEAKRALLGKRRRSSDCEATT